jgi:hypothetical protein
MLVHCVLMCNVSIYSKRHSLDKKPVHQTVSRRATESYKVYKVQNTCYQQMLNILENILSVD